MGLINEDFGMGDLYGGEMPYGAHFGSGQQLYDTFVKPFTDVAKTAVGKTSELSARAQTAVKVAFEALATTFIPILSSDYNEIFAEEKRKLDAIRQKYADVYRSSRDILGGNDVMVASLMFAPWAFLSAAMVKKSPAAALSLVRTLGGGNQAIERFVSSVQSRFAGGSGSSRSSGKWSSREDPGADTWAFEGSVYLGFIVSEEKNKSKEGADPRQELARLLTSEKLKSTLKKSPVAAQLSAAGQAVTKKTLRDVLSRATAIARAKNLEEIQRLAKKQVPALNQLKKLSPQDRERVQIAVLQRTRAAMKKFYVENLRRHAQAALSAGLNEDHPFVAAYAKAIKQVESAFEQAVR